MKPKINVNVVFFLVNQNDFSFYPLTNSVRESTFVAWAFY